MKMFQQKHRLRRTMLFLSAQKPRYIKDAYIYGSDSVIFDLEDAVAENQKDAARFVLYHTLRQINYRGVERLVRINGLNTPYWKEDIRVCVAGGADGIRIPKCECAQDVLDVQEELEKAEYEFGVTSGNMLLMAALESPRGILNALEICESTPRLFGIALSGSDLRNCLQAGVSANGIELMAARGQVLLAARAAGIQCFDTVFTDLDDADGFRRETELAYTMGFDGKSIINPKQIRTVHNIFTPTRQEIEHAEQIINNLQRQSELGTGVFALDGKMIDAAFLPGAERTLALAKAAGIYQKEESYEK